MTERQPYTFDRVIRILFGAVFVVGLFYLIYILRGALLPFLVAWIVAYMLNPLVVYNKRVFKLKGRVIAIALTFLEVLVTLALLAVLVLPSIIDEIGVMRRLLSDYVYHSSNIPFVPQAVHDFIRQNVDFTQDTKKILWRKFLTDERYADEGLGIYEGGCTYTKGIYRPTENSMMNDNAAGFNAPSRKAIYDRVMKEGTGNAPTYESFVDFDRQTSQVQKTRCPASPRKNKPLARPRFVGNHHF